MSMQLFKLRLLLSKLICELVCHAILTLDIYITGQ